MQSKVHLIWKSPIIEKRPVLWPAASVEGGGQQLCTGRAPGLPHGSGLTEESRAVTQRKYLSFAWQDTQEEAELEKIAPAGAPVTEGQRPASAHQANVPVKLSGTDSVTPALEDAAGSRRRRRAVIGCFLIIKSTDLRSQGVKRIWELVGDRSLSDWYRLIVRKNPSH